ncbi:hypothetical protein BURCENBC7_AP3913 [Burkholderia cenocepacia BC7]|nr:hypothetical protein BURCENK562V_C5519 [Burkholderia cenocepacia K56-2Valvano]ERI32177.1 hypothetical protein BURCENBC7_AP3913 [Burkholderia cenocepacia BC7]
MTDGACVGQWHAVAQCTTGADAEAGADARAAAMLPAGLESPSPQPASVHRSAIMKTPRQCGIRLAAGRGGTVRE